jgi:hypothetical protein
MIYMTMIYFAVTAVLFIALGRKPDVDDDDGGEERDDREDDGGHWSDSPLIVEMVPDPESGWVKDMFESPIESEFAAIAQEEYDVC